MSKLRYAPGQGRRHGYRGRRRPSGEYCRYCYQAGAFTAPEATLEDMIALNLKFNEENGRPMGTRAEAEQMMRSWYPTLKRWRQG